jgi:hypothetical protein
MNRKVRRRKITDVNEPLKLERYKNELLVIHRVSLPAPDISIRHQVFLIMYQHHDQSHSTNKKRTENEKRES